MKQQPTAKGGRHANRSISYSFLNFNFLVELDGITRAAFQECTLADATTEVVEYREGGDITTTRKLPGMTKYGNITLKWGMTDDTELYDWHRQTVQGNLERKNGSLTPLTGSARRSRGGTSCGRGSPNDAPDMNASRAAIAVPVATPRAWSASSRRQVMFQTEFELPCGYLGEDGTLHRQGIMRRATAADEIVPLRDPRVQKHPAYRVISCCRGCPAGWGASRHHQRHREPRHHRPRLPAGPVQRD